MDETILFYSQGISKIGVYVSQLFEKDWLRLYFTIVIV